MPVRQLTLYDFLADFVPGVTGILLFALLAWAIGVDISAGFGVSGGIVLVVVGYLAGRTFHAVAGQDESKIIRKLLFDEFSFLLEAARGSSAVDRDLILSEPSVPKRIEKAAEGDSDDSPFVSDLERRLLEESSFATIGLEDSIEEGSRQQYRRFGFSALFDESTLYQRYNILETFYRNLWFVCFAFGTLFVLSSGVALLWDSLDYGPIDDILVFIPGFLLILLYLVVVGASSDKSKKDIAKSQRRRWIILSLFQFSVLLASGLLAIPVVLILSPQAFSLRLSAVHLFALGVWLFSAAVLFNTRRIQFKDRQVRAFINDLYIHRIEESSD